MNTKDFTSQSNLNLKTDLPDVGCELITPRIDSEEDSFTKGEKLTRMNFEF